METKHYNVYIVSDTGKAQALIGSNLNAQQADKRVMTGLSRIDTNNYFVGDFEVGSERDLELKEDLNKKQSIN